MKNEPKIRIKGFEGEWKENLLGDICEINPHSELPDNFEYVDLESVVGTTMVAHRTENIKTAPSRAQRLAQYNDIFFQTVRPYQRNNYLFRKKEGVYVFSTGYAQIRTSMDSGFLFTILQSDSFVNQVILNSTGSSYPAINPTNLSRLSINIIENKSEQRAIATYFRHLDSLIETADKKISSLKQVKEASLQTMFPQEGQSVPKVRFKGFEGEWKIYKGDDLFETYNERNRPDLPVLSAFQDIRGMAVRSDSGYEISHDKRNEVTYKVVEPGQFVMHLRSFQGGFAHSAIEGITSPAYTVFGFKDPNANNDYYWKTIFMSKGFIDRLKTITYGIRDGRSISFPEFLQMKFRVPSIEEQLKLASFFVHLDKQIELAQQRLALLRRIKSACLDEMFV